MNLWTRVQEWLLQKIVYHRRCGRQETTVTTNADGALDVTVSFPAEWPMRVAVCNECSTMWMDVSVSSLIHSCHGEDREAEMRHIREMVAWGPL